MSEHFCLNCYEFMKNLEKCPECGTYVCSNCGKNELRLVLKDLSEEEKEEVKKAVKDGKRIEEVLG